MVVVVTTSIRMITGLTVWIGWPIILMAPPWMMWMEPIVKLIKHKLIKLLMKMLPSAPRPLRPALTMKPSTLLRLGMPPRSRLEGAPVPVDMMPTLKILTLSKTGGVMIKPKTGGAMQIM